MKVIVTRPREQAEPLVAALREQGFEPVVFPLIETVAIEDGPIEVEGYDWIVVTSANGAEQLARRRLGRVPRVAAVGPATAAMLAEHGLAVDFVPREAGQEGLVAELPRPVGRVLFVGAEGAGESLASQLDADVRAVYRTRELRPDSAPSGDLVLLGSGSAARAWAKLRLDIPAISIGRQTTAVARAEGVEVVGEARTPDVQGLVDSAAAWRGSLRS
jgi:uroporphyrinogen-III synthase